MSEDSKFERFGKYLILDHLVDGGMAKICRARFLGEQANKVVAIKMVQPQFTKDPSFVQMFEDELKVTFGLLHPNIAQVYDYGVVNGQLYTAMEYVDGANLKQYLDRLKEKKFVFPISISTHIISQVCQALHYAHTFKDKLTNQSINIIHRDISPHNIMVTYDGAVKVIDFGIAKADSNSEATQAGTIKGKLSYLAPEYLEGLELDHRYDQFAIGITLWEMLCSRKLFQAANDYAVLKQIQACKIPPPSSINPNVPKELDMIVLKSLSKDRNQRFEDVDQFNRALIKFLYSTYSDFNATDLGYFAKQLFKQEIQEDQEKFIKYGKIDITPYIADLNNDKSSASAVELKGQSLTKKIELDLGSFNKNSSDESPVELEIDDTSTRTRIQRPSSTSTRIGHRSTSSRSTRLRNSAATGVGTRSTRVKRNIKVSEERNMQSSMSLYIASFAVLVLSGILIYKFEVPKKIMTFFNGESEVNASRTISSSNEGILYLSNYDDEMSVYINSKLVEVDSGQVVVPLNTNIEVEVRQVGKKPYIYPSKVYLTELRSTQKIIVPILQDEKVGLLSTSLNFPSGSSLLIKIDGRDVRKSLPIDQLRLPVGDYTGYIENSLLGTKKKISFTINENKRTYLE